MFEFGSGFDQADASLTVNPTLGFARAFSEEFESTVVIGGNRTDCLKLVSRNVVVSKSRHRLLFSPNGKDKSTEKFLKEIALGSGGRL